MEGSIKRMAREIADLTGCGLTSFRLYGSVVLGDFRLGWSDIDFIALTEAPLTEEQAERLLLLRQRLSAGEPGNPYFRLFEGIILSRGELLSGSAERLVYWGTSGQRVTNRFGLDAFSRYELCRYGRTVFGSDESPLFALPSREELVSAVRLHLEGIRCCAVETDRSLYSCGWLLDIARCIYTLREGGVIAKTQAGEWALAEKLFPDASPLESALAIRRSPLEYKDREDVKLWLCGLGPTVQAYADVLEAELMKQDNQRSFL